MSRTFKDGPPKDRMLQGPKVSRCWLTKKVCFGSHEKAMERLIEIGGDASAPGRWRSYECNYCGFWHLTTKT